MYNNAISRIEIFNDLKLKTKIIKITVECL